MAISVRRAGLGRSIRVDKPMFLVQRTHVGSPLEVELLLGGGVLRSVVPSGAEVDGLLVAGSLPRVHSSLLGASLAYSSGAIVGAVSEFSGGCSSIIDAIHYLFCSAEPEKTYALVVVDSFLSSYKASSGGSSWADGAAAMRISPTGQINLTLRAYASSFDPEFLVMAHEIGGELQVPFFPRPLRNFEDVDVRTTRDLLHSALDCAGLRVEDLNCVVLSNRSDSSLSRTERVFDGCARLFESRKDYYHCGGADILINLSLAFDDIGRGIYCLIGYGLGYSWRLMILEVD
jgi:3-oxoacyl-[acyl-carrier-protein] synthase III